MCGFSNGEVVSHLKYRPAQKASREFNQILVKTELLCRSPIFEYKLASLADAHTHLRYCVFQISLHELSPNAWFCLGVWAVMFTIANAVDFLI